MYLELTVNGVTCTGTPGRSLFVKGLAKGANERHLLAIFSQFGELLDCQVARHRSGRSAGFAIVSFVRTEDAASAMSQVDNLLFLGRRLVVRWFSPEREAVKGAPGVKTNAGLTSYGSADFLALAALLQNDDFTLSGVNDASPTMSNPSGSPFIDSAAALAAMQAQQTQQEQAAAYSNLVSAWLADYMQKQEPTSVDPATGQPLRHSMTSVPTVPSNPYTNSPTRGLSLAAHNLEANFGSLDLGRSPEAPLSPTASSLQLKPTLVHPTLPTLIARTAVYSSASGSASAPPGSPAMLSPHGSVAMPAVHPASPLGRSRLNRWCHNTSSPEGSEAGDHISDCCNLLSDTDAAASPRAIASDATAANATKSKLQPSRQLPADDNATENEDTPDNSTDLIASMFSEFPEGVAKLLSNDDKEMEPNTPQVSDGGGVPPNRTISTNSSDSGMTDPAVVLEKDTPLAAQMLNPFAVPPAIAALRYNPEAMSNTGSGFTSPRANSGYSTPRSPHTHSPVLTPRGSVQGQVPSHAPVASLQAAAAANLMLQHQQQQLQQAALVQAAAQQQFLDALASMAAAQKQMAAAAAVLQGSAPTPAAPLGNAEPMRSNSFTAGHTSSAMPSPLLQTAASLGIPPIKTSAAAQPDVSTLLLLKNAGLL